MTFENYKLSKKLKGSKSDGIKANPFKISDPPTQSVAQELDSFKTLINILDIFTKDGEKKKEYDFNTLQLERLHKKSMSPTRGGAVKKTLVAPLNLK